MGVSLTVLADGLSPDNGQARDWARDAWTSPQPSALDRLSDDIGSWIYQRFADVAGIGKTIPGIIAIVVVVLLVALIIYALRFVRRTPRSAVTDGHHRVLTDDPTSAAAHRARAEELLAAGDNAGCIREAMRALTRRSIERSLLDDTPSLTAHEVAVRLQPAFGEFAISLTEAAGLFDRVVYGHATATAEQARSVLTLDADLKSARPSGTVGDAATAYAVPR
ncbi:DUF4129 domain-containing protein [Gordonia sp. DT219]|uniref:DUF4129 domain-containing protein n=1 Tax=Gordonia sp. DT219 TaxID=3416658 RepID=UPI003CEEB061